MPEEEMPQGSPQVTKAGLRRRSLKQWIQKKDKPFGIEYEGTDDYAAQLRELLEGKYHIEPGKFGTYHVHDGEDHIATIKPRKGNNPMIALYHPAKGQTLAELIQKNYNVVVGDEHEAAMKEYFPPGEERADTPAKKYADTQRFEKLRKRPPPKGYEAVMANT